MKTSAIQHRSLFAFGFAAVAMIAPILLVITAASLPDGERGELMVNGHCILVAVLAVGLVLRAAYLKGFSKAFQISATEPKRSVTAGW